MAQNDNTFDPKNSGQQTGGTTGGNAGTQGGYGDNANAHTGTPGSTGGMHGSGTSAGDRMDQMKDKATDAATQVKDKAADAASQMKDKASQAGSQMKEKATQLKSTLADKLDSGAERLRQRTSTATDQMAGGDPGNGAAATAKDTLNRASETLAGGMEKSADWMRTADMDSMRTGIEAQVRENPGRALLVALGVGYFLGKILRGSKES